MSRLFVVRHGDTFAPGEQPRRVGSPTDLPLVASGIGQAQALGAWFAAQELRFAQVLSGSLTRTQQTCRLIASAIGDAPPRESREWLDEIEHGPDENQPEDVVLARIGRERLDAWDTEALPPPDWIVDAPGRIGGWRRFLDTPPPGDTLLVTSNGAARFAFLAEPGLVRPKPMKLRTGALGLLDNGSGAWRLGIWDWRPPTLSA
jgi:broad specificity phosphatase PhoE